MLVGVRERHRSVADGRHVEAVVGQRAAQPGAVITRRDLVRAAWPEGAIVYDNTLDQYVARLRRKLRAVASEAEITTARGVGYRFG